MKTSLCHEDRPPLAARFYERPTEKVARALLGKVIVRRRPGALADRARIMEVEAYLGERDAASHARFGPTPRSAIMFGPPGRLYVYLIYGMHHCMNFVTETHGTAGAVLIRAAQPLNEHADTKSHSGPGKLCAALQINRSHNGLDLTCAGSTVFVVDDGFRVRRVASSPRIGIDNTGFWGRRLLRFFVAASPAVSGPRR